MPGSGKSTLGKLLSKELKKDFFDSDEFIEKTENEKIENIFKFKGECYFRNLERKALKEKIVTLKNSIIATGGGLPIFNHNIEILKSLGLVVYIEVNVETLMNRKNLKNRPLLKEDLQKSLIELYEKRANIYKRAHITINCDKKAINEALNVLKSELEKV